MEIVARPGSAAGTAGCRASKRKLRELAQGLAGFADSGVSLQVRPKQCVDRGPILEGPNTSPLQEPVVNRDRQVGQGIASPVLHGFSVARASGAGPSIGSRRSARNVAQIPISQGGRTTSS